MYYQYSQITFQDVCKCAALALQYFFGVTFILQALEALHIYTVLSNVVMGNELFLKLKPTLAIAWGMLHDLWIAVFCLQLA